jgi:hypothetical protein
MSATKRLAFFAIVISTLALLAACSGESTPTPTASPAATTTPQPTPTSTATPRPTETPTPDPDAGAVKVESLMFEDGGIKLTVGAAPAGGYESGQVLDSSEGDGWVLKLDVGDKLVVGTIGQASGAAEWHRFSLPDLGVSFPLSPDEGGSSVTNWRFTFFEEGIYALKDAHNHGKAWIAVGDVDLGGYQSVTYVLDQIRVRDAALELRVGDVSQFGYEAGARPTTADGDITLTINATDKIVFTNGFVTSSGNLGTYNLTIAELGIDVVLPPGSDTNQGIELTFDEPGTYEVTDSANPDRLQGGKLTILVNPKPSGAPLPVTHVLDQIRLRDTAWELRMGSEALWGYEAAARIRTDETGDISIFLNKGDKIVFTNGFVTPSGNVATYVLAIEGLGVHVSLPPGSDTNQGIELAFDEPGVYEVTDPSDPDHVQGKFFIYVKDAAALPATYILDEIRLRDDAYELRMGTEALWGYDPEARVLSSEVGTIRVVLNAGDKIVLPDGLTAGSSNTVTANITIDAIGLNVTVPPGTDTNQGIELKFDEPGVYEVYDSVDPERVQGEFFIIVQ